MFVVASRTARPTRRPAAVPSGPRCGSAPTSVAVPAAVSTSFALTSSRSAETSRRSRTRARVSASASRACSRTSCSEAPASWVRPLASRRSASSALSAMTCRWWPWTSCRSAAKRSRSRVTARSAACRRALSRRCISLQNQTVGTIMQAVITDQTRKPTAVSAGPEGSWRTAAAPRTSEAAKPPQRTGRRRRGCTSRARTREDSQRGRAHHVPVPVSPSAGKTAPASASGTVGPNSQARSRRPNTGPSVSSGGGAWKWRATCSWPTTPRTWSRSRTANATTCSVRSASRCSRRWDSGPNAEKPAITRTQSRKPVQVYHHAPVRSPEYGPGPVGPADRMPAGLAVGRAPVGRRPGAAAGGAGRPSSWFPSILMGLTLRA